MLPHRNFARVAAHLLFLSASFLVGMMGIGTLAGCGGPRGDEGLLVSVAANLQPAMMELGDVYRTQTGHEVTFNFASSGKLAQQIHEGAPVDMFISADAHYVNELTDAGLIQSQEHHSIARGRLVIWTTGPEAFTLKDLAQPEIARIAMANPDHAPYGRAAQEALMAADLWKAVHPKLVYGENVFQAFQFAESRDADAALASLSQAILSTGTWTLVPENLHSPLEQTAAILSRSQHRAQAQQFLEFLTGAKAQAILERYGYEVIGP